MKFNQIMITATLAISTTAYANNGVPEPSNINEQIYGSWSCQYNLGEAGSKVTIDSEETYVRNGHANSFAIMKAKFAPELPEMEYSLASSAIWNVEDGYLITTLDDIKIVNLSHPEFDKIINLQDMFPKNASESSKILELTDSKMSLKSESNGSVYHCTKKFVKPVIKDFKFETGSSVFKIEEIEKIGIYSTHEYSFNGKKLGVTELVALEASLIGSSKDTDYFIVKGGTGGSACAEVFSIVSVKNDYLVFSPQIAACGGIVSIDYKERRVPRVNVKVLDRYERTITRYEVTGSIVLSGNKEMENQHSFLH